MIANWCNASPQFLIGIVHFFEILCKISPPAGARGLYARKPPPLGAVAVPCLHAAPVLYVHPLIRPPFGPSCLHYFYWGARHVTFHQLTPSTFRALLLGAKPVVPCLVNVLRGSTYHGRFMGCRLNCAALPRGLLPLAANLYGCATKGSTLPPRLGFSLNSTMAVQMLLTVMPVWQIGHTIFHATYSGLTLQRHRANSVPGIFACPKMTSILI